MGAVPAGGEGMDLLRFEVDKVDLIFAKAERSLQRLDQA